VVGGLLAVAQKEEEEIPFLACTATATPRVFYEFLHVLPTPYVDYDRAGQKTKTKDSSKKNSKSLSISLMRKKLLKC
jgi:hypothetical protein